MQREELVIEPMHDVMQDARVGAGVIDHQALTNFSHAARFTAGKKTNADCSLQAPTFLAWLLQQCSSKETLLLTAMPASHRYKVGSSFQSQKSSEINQRGPNLVYQRSQRSSGFADFIHKAISL